MPVYKHVNKKFFSTWTNEMSYVLGFLMADGSMDTNTRGSQYFSIQIADKLLLEKIRKVLDSEHVIAVRSVVGSTRKHYRLQIGSKEMCGELRKLGMSEHKTHTMQMPQVPTKYFANFVRGYFDGDGNIWMGEVHKDRKTATIILHTVFTSCSKSFLVSLQKQLIRKGFGTGSLFFSRKAYRLQYSVKDSILLYQLMYQYVFEGLELPRKRKVFEQYITMRS